MSDEEAFQAALDANPDDHTTRLVFADWLQERGDLRAEGYRALGATQKYPFIRRQGNFKPGSAGWTRTSNRSMPRCYRLAEDWWRLVGSSVDRNAYFVFHSNRRQSEDAAALAFSHLSAKRRATLLVGKGTKPTVKKPKGKK